MELYKRIQVLTVVSQFIIVNEESMNIYLLSEMDLMSATVHVPEGTIVGGRVLFAYTVNAEGRRRSFGYFVSLRFARRNAWFHLDSVVR